MDTASILNWAFVSEVPIPDDIGPILVGGEQPVAAYKAFRDSAVFTTKRLIVRDAQGTTGKKVEIYSLPYCAIRTCGGRRTPAGCSTSTPSWSCGPAPGTSSEAQEGVDIRKLDHLIPMAAPGWALSAVNCEPSA